MHLAQLRASLHVNWLLLCGSQTCTSSRPFLVQRCTDEASGHVVRACSAAGRGVGVGQEGSQSASVQQVSDKAQERCKIGSPSQVSSDPRGPGTEVCGWGGMGASYTENDTRACLREMGWRGHYL